MPATYRQPEYPLHSEWLCSFCKLSFARPFGATLGTFCASKVVGCGSLGLCQDYPRLSLAPLLLINFFYF